MHCQYNFIHFFIPYKEEEEVKMKEGKKSQKVNSASLPLREERISNQTVFCLPHRKRRRRNLKEKRNYHPRYQ